MFSTWTHSHYIPYSQFSQNTATIPTVLTTAHSHAHADKPHQRTTFQRWTLLGCIVLIALIPVIGLADESAPELSNHSVELSFGNSKLFTGSSNFENTDDSELNQLPTSSALFLGEWLMGESWSALLVFNLPLTPHRAILDGKIVEKQSAPTLSMGIRWSPWSWLIAHRARLETQLAAILGTPIGPSSYPIIFPTLGGRLHLSRPDGFSMYIGATWSLRRETAALVYGVGHRF